MAQRGGGRSLEEGRGNSKYSLDLLRAREILMHEFIIEMWLNSIAQ